MEHTTNDFCTIENCNEPFVAKGYCRYHYNTARRYGDPLHPGSGRFISKGETFAERFWSRVAIKGEDECWEWQAGRFTNKKREPDYGCVTYEHRAHLAHRIAWLLHYGLWPSMDLLHSCNNPLCCNYHHLREGTNLENVQDRIKAGRQPMGSRINTAKLVESQVTEIVKLMKIGRKLTHIAREYGVSVQSIDRIKAGKTWKHVPR